MARRRAMTHIAGPYLRRIAAAGESASGGPPARPRSPGRVISLRATLRRPLLEIVLPALAGEVPGVAVRGLPDVPGIRRVERVERAERRVADDSRAPRAAAGRRAQENAAFRIGRRPCAKAGE